MLTVKTFAKGLTKKEIEALEKAAEEDDGEEPAEEEQVTIDFAFATICSIKEIRKGEKFSKENILFYHSK